jgi:AcrR family transcriptional regulator
METARRTRRDSQAQTRAELIAAAREVFLARGFHAATLEEIAERAGYTKGAVYSNFAGKDDLFRAPFSALLDVRRYQIAQEADGLHVRIVLRDPERRDLLEQIRAAIAGELEAAGAAPVAVRVEPVDEIERDSGHAAKVKLVTSALD